MTSMHAPAISSALEVRDLRVVYTSRGGEPVTALRGVSLTVERGEFLAVMGPSGSGKSSLLMAIAGLEAVASGSVVVGGVDVAGLREPALTTWRRGHLGMVFQANNLLASMTARENVELPLRWARRRVPLGRADDLLERLGVAERRTHLPVQMSGGQQQRVAIARALITSPDVIVADEPTGALDRHAAAGVLQELRGLVDTEGRTVVLVTHDPVAAAHADRLVVLVDGRLVEDIAMDPRQPGASSARAAAVLARVSG